MIERTNLADQLDRYLDVPSGSGDTVETEVVPWERYYLGVSALGTALVVGTVLGVPVLGALPEVAIGGIIVAAFAVTTAAQMLYKR